jgi:hypothetical protein
MTKKVASLVFGICFILVLVPAMAIGQSWNPGDPHKMHFPQLPDEAGWDVNATSPNVLADDWRCSETGWIKDLHFWGSWKDGIEGQISAFLLNIHTDLPIGHPNNPFPYSIPGDLIWEAQISDFNAVAKDPPTLEGWYDLSTGEILWDNHQAYFQYDILLPSSLWFMQQQGTIYWLEISAVVSDPVAVWGWKSSLNHWNDDAVWFDEAPQIWVDIWEPAKPIVNGFTAQMIPGTQFVGTGEDAFGDQWYFYPSGWWNVWFYDHLLDLTRKKEFFVFVNVVNPNPLQPLDLVFAINWSTDQWDISTEPPLPGTDEAAYIGRQVFEVDEGPNEIRFEIPDYNPEWVSIDVMGTNFLIDGFIEHTCRGSLDLAFVVTGEPDQPTTGACCLNDGTCQVVTQAECGDLNGVYQGDGSSCLGDVNPQNGIDDLCETIFQQGACCYGADLCVVTSAAVCVNTFGGTYMGDGVACLGDLNGNGRDDLCERGACCFNDGSCQNLSPQDCATLGGVYMGAGTNCLGDVNPQNGVDDACETVVLTGACCFDDGSCLETTSQVCASQGGNYLGNGTICQGDVNPQNGIDDACESQQGFKWRQPPDLEPTGMDVNASFTSLGGMILADDFKCTVTGPLTELRIWGSWYRDEYPDAPDNVIFTVSLHEDVPAFDPVDFPIPCPWYPATGDKMVIAEGLPEGATIEIIPRFSDPTCQPDRCSPSPDPTKCEQPGGSLGGTHYCDIEIVQMDLVGTGPLTGFSRVITMPADIEVELGPRDQGASTRSIDIEMLSMDLSGAAPGDPDFDFLRIQAGRNHGLPSPGHTTLSRLGPPGSDFQVDSFFDIFYRIDFQGAPGSQLEGMSGSSTGTIRMEQKDEQGGDCTVSPTLVQHSYPGEVLCVQQFGSGEFEVVPYANNLNEGWYDPSAEFYDPNGDTECWQYIFPLDPDCFIQKGSPSDPVVYWIDVHAEPTDPNFFFGWKTSYQHWNDDATWAIGVEPYGGPWNELRYPANHPWFGESIDLAFELYGEQIDCDCRPGDADGTLPIDILDIVHLIDWKFKGCPPGQPVGTCPPPTPYPVCSGDADCNCVMDILDIVLLIDWKFKGCPPGAPVGTCPPPCSCEDWVANCGYPIYKK